MANTTLYQFRYSYERDVAEIFAKVAIGASGAPTLVNAKGIKSIVRNSAGNYTVHLKDNFYLFLNADQKFISGASAPAAPSMNVVSEQVNDSTDPSMVIQMRATGGAATDPASGEVLLLHIVCRIAST